MSESTRSSVAEPQAKTEAARSEPKQSEPRQHSNGFEAQILHRQKTVGNRAVQRLINSGELQAPVKAAPNPAHKSRQPVADVTSGVTDRQTPDASSSAVLTSNPTQPAISGEAGTQANERTTPPVTAEAGATVRPSANEPPAKSANATGGVEAGQGGTERGMPTVRTLPGNETPAAPAAQIDLSSSKAILESLGSAPASGFAAALTAVKGKLPAVQSREKREAQETVPVIDTPTGMPTLAAPRGAAGHAAFPSIQTPKAPVTAAGKVTPPEPTPQTPGPVPGSQVPLPKGEPATADDSGSWWSWLVDRLHNFFGSLPTSDPNLSTSAGPHQRVTLDGDADPAQNVKEEATAGQSVKVGRSHADSAILDDFGENAIAPTVPRGKSRTAYRPAPGRQPPASRRAPGPPKLPANERALFDEKAAPWITEQVGEQDAGYRRQQAVYQQAVKKAQDDGARQLAEENARTRADQVALLDAAKADVGGARELWRDENSKIEAEFGDKSSAKRRDVDREIGDKVAATHRDADAAFDQAEKKAEAEKTKAETEAAAKKKEEEDKPRSWWDRVKGAVSDVFNAIRGAITAIFDKVRAVVKDIVDAAKKAVHTLIEAARSAIVGMIHAFGEFLKGLVTIALAAFPKAAAKARAWIDDRVKGATNAVNRAATALEHAAQAILDGIAKGIDAALDILQAGLMAAIDVIENVALLPFKIASALETFWEILKILKSGVLQKIFDAAKDPKKLAQPVVDKVEPLAGQVPVKANQFALEKGQEAGTPASMGSSRQPTIVQRQSAKPEKSVGDQAAELILEGHIKESEMDVPSPAPGEGFWGGVWRHLKAAGNNFLQNWKTTLINLVYSLLLFYPVLLQEGPKLWEECKGVIFGGGGVDRFDHVLGVLRHLVNIIAGLVATTGIWALIIGAFTGPGEAFVVGAYETISLGVIGADVALGLAEMGKAWYSATREGISAKTRETYLSMFSGSAISTAITIILVLLGAIASRLAKAFKARRAAVGEAGEHASGTGEKTSGDKGETGGGGDKVPSTAGQQHGIGDSNPGRAGDLVKEEAAKGNKPDESAGHDVWQTREGCVVCSNPCDFLGGKFRDKFTSGTPDAAKFTRSFHEMEAMPDGPAKIAAEKALVADLEAAPTPVPTPPGAKGTLNIEPGVTLSPSERAAAEFWVDQGKATTAAKPSTVSGVQTADLNVEGIGRVDVYTPEATTDANRVVGAILRKGSQTSMVHVELPPGSAVTAPEVARFPARIFGHPTAGKGINRILVRQNGAVILDEVRR